MTSKKSGLGKGLDALFGPAPEEEQLQENDLLIQHPSQYGC